MDLVQGISLVLSTGEPLVKIVYFDCFSGICGDMILGALIDLGMDETFFIKEIKKLRLSGYTITMKHVECNHIGAVDVTINIKEKQHHRSLSDITKILKNSTLDPWIIQQSQTIFYKLAEAESKIHNVDIEQVHFHEVGAVDSIIDIVGSVIGIKHLGIEEIYCSPLPLGHGFVTCDHGILPLPAPATMELLKGVPVYTVNRDQELVTPTGAAIITTLTQHFGEMPPMKITSIGYGTGKIQSKYPNMLRIMFGERIQLKKKSKTKKKQQ